jgi:hypothetical protein
MSERQVFAPLRGERPIKRKEMTKKKKGDMPNWHDYDESIEVPPWEEVPWGMPIQMSLGDVKESVDVKEGKKMEVNVL